jgi:hypothetical protein
MADSLRPERVEKLRGQVTRGEYAKGSKSEREAVFIETSAGRYILRRKDGPAFADPQLERYVGQSVECDGFLVGTTLLAERIGMIGAAKKRNG